MKVATISQVKSQLSALLKAVEAGEHIVIVNRDRPVARLEPAGAPQAEGADERLDRLERLGVIRAAAKPPDASLADSALAPAPNGAGLLRALLEEREQGR